MNYSFSINRSRISTHLKPYLPAILAAVILWVQAIVCVKRIMALNEGHFAYAIDDCYIHMAVSKHLAAGGVFGVTPYSFSSANSSIIWPLLLALVFKIDGPCLFAPLLINLALCSGMLIHLNKILNRMTAGIKCSIKPVFVFLFLFAFIALVSFPMLIFIGMEHSLQVWIVIAFIDNAIMGLFDTHQSKADRNKLLALAVLMTATRWDDGICVAVVAALLFWKGRFIQAILIAVAAAIPVACFAIISLHFHWYPLPNSIILKSLITHPFNLTQVPLTVTQIFSKPWHLWLLALTGTGVSAKRRSDDTPKPGNYWALVYGASTLIYFQSSVIPEGVPLYYHRYDSFLVAIGMMAIANIYCELWRVIQDEPAAASSLLTRGWVLNVTVAVAIVAALLTGWIAGKQRMTTGIALIPQACHNIYEQQYQMGMFLHRYYTGQGVALNDIGAANYYADIHLTDLTGLADMRIARAGLAGNFNTDTIRTITQRNQTRIAIVYDPWFTGAGLPPEWVKLGQWQMRDNVTCGWDIVTIYGATLYDSKNALVNLREFGKTMPKDIVQTLYAPRL